MKDALAMKDAPNRTGWREAAGLGGLKLFGQDGDGFDLHAIGGIRQLHDLERRAGWLVIPQVLGRIFRATSRWRLLSRAR